MMVMGTLDEAGWFPVHRDGVTVPAPGLEFTVQRTCMLRVLIRAVGTGEPLPQYAIEFKREVHEDGELKLKGFRSTGRYDEKGQYELPVPRGRLQLYVEAAGREPVHASVMISDTAGPKEVLIEMHPGAEAK